MASKRKFKRDYIILEAKDMNFRYKERILPKAFAKVEVNDEKSVVALYVENLKYVKEGYRVVAIQSDYDTVDLGNILVSEQGKGEFILNLENNDAEIKGIAMLYEKTVPLIGFKGSKIDNYEEILFTGDDIIDDEEEYEEYEEIEYIEVDEDDDDFEEYEEIEYIEIDEEEDEEALVRHEENVEDEFEEYDETYEYEENEVYPEIEDEVEYIVENSPKITGNLPYEQRKTKVSNKNIKENSKVKEKVRDNSNSYESSADTSYKYEPKTAGALLMPRQIKKGLKLFREVKPFVSDYIEDTRWWKIEVNPVTLCGYTMPHLGYVNALNYTMYSDTVMSSYKYRHYLFGVQYDEYNKRKNYIYAIPGNKNEQPDKGRTGFNTYQACDVRNDNLGYWLCFIDSRTRRVVK